MKARVTGCITHIKVADPFRDSQCYVGEDVVRFAEAFYLRIAAQYFINLITDRKYRWHLQIPMSSRQGLRFQLQIGGRYWSRI